MERKELVTFNYFALNNTTLALYFNGFSNYAFMHAYYSSHCTRVCDQTEAETAKVYE